MRMEKLELTDSTQRRRRWDSFPALDQAAERMLRGALSL